MKAKGVHSTLDRIHHWWAQQGQPQRFFLAYAALMMLSLFTAIAGSWYFLAAIPAACIIVYLTIVDVRAVFTLLLICIPLSTELQLPNGLGLDLPTEPLMVGLMLVSVLLLVRQGLS